MTMTTRATEAARNVSTSTGSTSRGRPRQVRVAASGAPAHKKQRMSPTPVRLDNNDDSDNDTVLVSSNVRIAAAGAGGPRDDSSSDEDVDNNRSQHREDDSSRQHETPQREGLPVRAVALNQQNQDADDEEDDLNDMSWWDVLTPAQKRGMAKRLVAATPTPAPAAQTIVVREQRSRRKELKIDDFKGKPGESVEAWLASVLEEVKSQERLGGDTWTAGELFSGAVQHLKGKAQKWYISHTETMELDDCTFAFLVERMRAKYGRRDNAWQIQQRLAKRVQQPGERLRDFADSLLDIGFEKRVPAETYVEAFLNGMNNEVMSTQTRGADPQTLEEAVQYAEDKCGEYGEGRKVTDWEEARRCYRMGRDSIGDDETGRWKKERSEVNDQIDWKKLGLGFGGESRPVYDTAGKSVSGLAEKAKEDPLSLAAIQALMAMVGVGKFEDAVSTTPKAAAAKTKARALEVKAECRMDAEDDAHGRDAPAAQQNWRNDGYEGSGGRGFSGRWSSRGRGRGNVGGRGFAAGHYGPVDARDTRPIAQRKAESECSYCGQRGHWWRKRAVRIAAMGEEEAAQLTAATKASKENAVEAKAKPPQRQGNEARQ
ncbi:unnamed protein product [Phytophthora fragariaefolia]|uniref:Unnamed protein product n=1 Tax=Phytophthora fragariaefolia TaxID=1490495 RepID=A0A9W6XAT9_9STRA|nr:unnamed protein product [Phytophthora fragariaefolia]